MAKIISFTNQKGGVGKTTTCVNLSAYLALKGKKVLLLDMDPQGNACSSLGLDNIEGKSMYDLLLGDALISEVIYDTKVKNLQIVPSTIDLAGSEIDLVYMENRESVLKESLNSLRDKYDYMFIDCPPSLGLLTVNALTASDSIIIPIQCEYFALVGLGQLMNTVRLIKKHLNEKLEIEGVLLTMKDNRSNLVHEVSDEIVKYFGNKVYKSFIPRNVRLAEAPSHNLPIALYDPKSRGGMAYKEFADEFIKKQ